MTYGSLFTGVGGLDLGLDRAHFTCRWQVENDPYAIRVLEKHWPEVKRYGDITKVNGNELEPVDLICGGFPCQDLSQAGKRIGIEGTRSGLWFEYARIVGVVRPRFVLIENVPGLLVPSAMSRVVGELARLGYVGCWRSLRASEFGASHLRKRVFIVAYRDGEPSDLHSRERAGIPVLAGNGSQLAYRQDDGSEFRPGSRPIANGSISQTGTGGIGTVRGEPVGRSGVLAYRECERSERRGDAGILEGAAAEEHREALQRQRNGHAADDSGDNVAYRNDGQPSTPHHHDGHHASGHNADGCDPHVAHGSIERCGETRGLRYGEVAGTGGIGDDLLAHGARGGLGELREASGCDGLPDGSHEAVGNPPGGQREQRRRPLKNERDLPGPDGRCDPLADPRNGLLQKQGRGPEGRDGAGSGSEELGNAANLGLQGFRADGQQIAGAHGRERLPLRPSPELGQFAPGPSDPRWPSILRERPDLAPALESPLRGVADGLPHLTHRGLNDDQVGSEKSRTKAGKNRRVPALRCDGKTPAASPGLLQAARRDDSLPAVPHRTADEGRHLGERSEESEGLQNMRQELHAASLQKPYDLQPGVPAGDWAAERDAPLAFTGPDENMPVVPDGIPVCAPAPDDLQQKLRQQTGVGEQAYWDEQIRLAMSNRTKRLGRLGNAVVPQIAEWIGRRILEFEEGRK